MEVKNHPFLIAVKQVIQENRKVDEKRKKSKKKAWHARIGVFHNPEEIVGGFYTMLNSQNTISNL